MHIEYICRRNKIYNKYSRKLLLIKMKKKKKKNSKNTCRVCKFYT